MTLQNFSCECQLGWSVFCDLCWKT